MASKTAPENKRQRGTSKTRALGAVRPTTVFNQPQWLGDAPSYQYLGLSREQLQELGFKVVPGFTDGINVKRAAGGRFNLYCAAQHAIDRDARFRDFLAKAVGPWDEVVSPVRY